MGDRVTNLLGLEGLSIKDAERMPMPWLLSRWSDAGFYRIDIALGVFRLTAAGRAQSKLEYLLDD